MTLSSRETLNAVFEGFTTIKKPPVFHRGIFQDWDVRTLQALIDIGFLHQGARPEFMNCPVEECGQGCLCRVHYSDTMGAYLICPEGGGVNLKNEDLITYTLNFETIAKFICEKLDTRPAKFIYLDDTTLQFAKYKGLDLSLSAEQFLFINVGETCDDFLSLVKLTKTQLVFSQKAFKELLQDIEQKPFRLSKEELWQLGNELKTPNNTWDDVAMEIAKKYTRKFSYIRRRLFAIRREKGETKGFASAVTNF